MWRRIFCLVTFVPIGVAVAAIALAAILRWAIHWLRTGEADDSLLLNRPLEWLVDLPGRILHGKHQEQPDDLIPAILSRGGPVTTRQQAERFGLTVEAKQLPDEPPG